MFNRLFTKLFAIATILAASAEFAVGQESPAFRPVNSQDPKGRELPAGVPRTLDTNGNVIYIDQSFTTKQYRTAAIQAALPEANNVAGELQLEENMPIVESNLTEVLITPFGFNYAHKGIGGISTSNYVYYFTKANKFNKVVDAAYTRTCLSYKNVSFALKDVDYKSAFQLATQRLASVSMDVAGLQRECTPHVALSPHWNGLAHLGDEPRKTFVPIYYIWWTSAENNAKGFGGVARVELFLPTKKLLQLSVDDPKYILREPLKFENLASLFPGKAKIEVFTNFPAQTNIPVGH